MSKGVGFFRGEKSDETRVAITPGMVGRYLELGIEVFVEAGLGGELFLDDMFVSQGARVLPRGEGFDLVKVGVCLSRPDREKLAKFKPGMIQVGLLDPFQSGEWVEALVSGGINAISLEMIPRITRAQKMDVLSSQASLAGYAAVITAADRLDRLFPMMVTPAGTISPARVLVIGAGVAGLQAIATAKRLGARVEAFDTREEVAEQVRSLGGKFVSLDLGETGKTEAGYAKALSAEQLAQQREGLKRVCAQMDVVITTAQVFGRRAPVIVTEEMVRNMKQGAVVVDLAVGSGGNVEGIVPGKEVMVEGVRLVGLHHFPGLVARDASEMLASNIYQLISTLWNQEQAAFVLDRDDEILKSALITMDGQIVNDAVLQAMKQEGERE